MHVDTFLAHVAQETDRVVRRTTSIRREALDEASRRGGMAMSDLLAAPNRVAAPRDVRYGHVLGAPTAPASLDAWAQRHPDHALPADLRALVARVNGIHLWADLETGRAYTGMSPLEDWDLARVSMYGATADRDLLDDRYVALTYHQDGAAYVVLDTTSARYFLMDTAGPDESSPVANSASELLDWLGHTRIPPT